jgi:ABC-2 type transport system ATP-binding protein
MLALLSSLAVRPGKSLVLSSHLLGDVERVCQWAIVLDQGRVIGQGRIEQMRHRRRTAYRVRWRGEGGPFLRELVQHGCDVLPSTLADEARVVVPQDWNTRTFFASARRHATLVTGLEPEEENFEAVYHRLLSSHEP